MRERLEHCQTVGSASVNRKCGDNEPVGLRVRAAREQTAHYFDFCSALAKAHRLLNECRREVLRPGRWKRISICEREGWDCVCGNTRKEILDDDSLAPSRSLFISQKAYLVDELVCHGALSIKCARILRISSESAKEVKISREENPKRRLWRCLALVT